jgi:hypothetical protein
LSEHLADPEGELARLLRDGEVPSRRALQQVLRRHPVLQTFVPTLVQAIEEQCLDHSAPWVSGGGLVEAQSARDRLGDPTDTLPMKSSADAPIDLDKLLTTLLTLRQAA